MMNRKILDTNVFRNLAEGNLLLDDIRQPGAELCCSPSSILELSSRFTDESYEHRRKTARVILDSNVIILPDNESYLTADIFNLPLKNGGFDWMEILQGIVLANSIEELKNGVADHANNVMRKVKLDLAKQHRDMVDQKFVNELVGIQCENIPGFGGRNKSRHFLSKKDRPRYIFGNDVDTIPYRAGLFLQCRQRAGSKDKSGTPCPKRLPKQPDDALLSAWSKLEFYLKIAVGYMRRLLINDMKPEGNDWWDFEILMYSQDNNHVIVTSDKKWVSLATEMGMGHRIIKV